MAQPKGGRSRLCNRTRNCGQSWPKHQSPKRTEHLMISHSFNHVCPLTSALGMALYDPVCPYSGRTQTLLRPYSSISSASSNLTQTAQHSPAKLPGEIRMFQHVSISSYIIKICGLPVCYFWSCLALFHKVCPEKSCSRNFTSTETFVHSCYLMESCRVHLNFQNRSFSSFPFVVVLKMCSRRL